MYTNPNIVSISKVRYQRIFKDFLTERGIVDCDFTKEIGEWVSIVVKRFIQNAFLPSGEQFRLLNNVGYDHFNEVILALDHEDINVGLLVKMQDKYPNLKITCEFHSQLNFFLTSILADLKRALCGKNVYAKVECHYDSEYQVTYQELNQPIHYAMPENEVPDYAIADSNAMLSLLGSGQFDLETIANKVEMYNEGLCFGN